MKRGGGTRLDEEQCEEGDLSRDHARVLQLRPLIRHEDGSPYRDGHGAGIGRLVASSTFLVLLGASAAARLFPVDEEDVVRRLREEDVDHVQALGTEEARDEDLQGRARPWKVGAEGQGRARMVGGRSAEGRWKSMEGHGGGTRCRPGKA